MSESSDFTPAPHPPSGEWATTTPAQTPPASASAPTEPIAATPPPTSQPISQPTATPVPAATPMPSAVPVPAAVPLQPGAQPPPQPQPYYQAPPPRKRGLLAALGALGVVGILALAGLSGYLWFVNTQWTEQNEQLRAEATALGASLAEERLDAEVTAEELAQTQAQLTNARDRLSDIVNEEANAVDTSRVLRDIADHLTECATQRGDLIDDINSGRFTTASLNAVRRGLNDYCGSVMESYAEYLSDRGLD